jgi:hypothetical protein
MFTEHKMNLLHLFVLFIFLIGFLLIITTFTAYSKLGDCNSEGLRTKLRWAICIGTVCMTLAIGYTICINKAGCNCVFGDRSDWKIYSALFVLMGMGVGLLVLTIGIKNDAKSDGCNIDLGFIPDLLMALSICQIILPILYASYIIYNNVPNKKDTKDEEDDEEDDDDSLALEAESRKTAIDGRRSARFKKRIALAEEELSQVRDRIESSKARKKAPAQKDKEKEEILVKEIAKATSELGSVKSPDSSVSSSNADSSPSTSVLPWGMK